MLKSNKVVPSDLTNLEREREITKEYIGGFSGFETELACVILSDVLNDQSIFSDVWLLPPHYGYHWKDGEKHQDH